MLTIAPRESIGRSQKPTTVMRGQASRLPWAWTGLCFAVPFHQSGNEGTRDIANNVTPSIRNNVLWTRDASGNTAGDLRAETDARLEYPDTPTHDRPSTELTVHVRLKWNGFLNGWPEFYGGIACNRISTIEPWSTWAVNQNAGNNGIIEGQVTVNGKVRPLLATDVTLPTTEYSNIFLRWRSGEAVVMDIFGEHGQTLTSSAGSATASGTLTYQAGEGIRINAGEDQSVNFTAYYSQVMVWSRKLTTTEMTWLTQDPFGWYSPRRETVGISSPYPLIGGGGEMKSGTGGGGIY